MHVFLGFEPYLLTSSQAKCRVSVSTSHFKVHMAATVDVNARVWVSWALAKNMSGKQIEMQVLLGFEPFSLSSSVAE